MSHAFLHLDEADRRWWLALVAGSLLLSGLDALLPPASPWLFWQTISSWWWAVLVEWGAMMGGTAVTASPANPVINPLCS